MARSFSQILSATVTAGLVVRRLTSTSPFTDKTAAPTLAGARTTQDWKGHPKGAPGIAGKYRLLRRAIAQFLDDDCATMAAALAYYTTFSTAPLLLIVISIVGLVFGRDVVQHQIQVQIQGLIGESAASQIGLMVESAGQHSSAGVLSAVLGIVALLAGATGAFGQLQSALNTVWKVKPDPRTGGINNFIGHRLLSLGMVLAIAFLLLVSLTVSAALSALGTVISGYLPRLFSAPLLMAIGFISSFILITALFAGLFKVLPDARIVWRDIWAGAAITAFLFTGGKFLIGLYLGQSGTASAYGAAGSFVLIVLWIYYSSMILLFGAELTAAWSEAHSGPVQPKPGAVKVDTVEKIQPANAT
jgi:membrane protein